MTPRAFEGKRYKVFPEELTWHGARIKCEEMGGNAGPWSGAKMRIGS